MILKSGKKLIFTDATSGFNKLPVANWLLKFNDRSQEYELEETTSFKIPEKIYGDTSHINRWKRSFEFNTSKNLGIVLAGVKGGGKTIDAQLFCKIMNLPVIIITEDFCGPEFIKFISSPQLGTCIIFIDEFEKIYGRGTHDNSVDLLSLMDGNFQTNLIFLLTVNDLNLDKYLVNRLNRIKYCRQYIDLSDEIIEEVINDKLINKDHKNSIYEFFDKVGIRTFDLLINIIKEMNLFQEDALECGKHLNLKAEEICYDVYEEYDDKQYKQCPSLFSNLDPHINIDRGDIGFIKEDDEKTNKDYCIVLEKALCIIENFKNGSMIITDPTQNVKFKLIPKNSTSLIF